MNRRSAEGEGMDHAAQHLRLVGFAESGGQVVEHQGAFLWIDGIDVMKAGFAAQRANLGDDFIHADGGRMAVEVDADDIHASPRQFERDGRAKAARGAKNQSPFLRLITVFLQLFILQQIVDRWLAL
jgi:hypothetical protein